MVSGIQSLPVELLGKIFEECAPSDDITVMHPKLSCLLQVCRFWNQILLSQPSFWSYIRTGILRRPSITLVELWIQRSGTTYPLSLIFHLFFDKEMESKVIDLIVPHVHRWKVIDLQLGSRDPYDALCNLPHGSMPILESAAILAFYWPEGAIVRLWDTIGLSPLLSKAEVNNLSAKLVASLPLPWHRLTAFETPNDIECGPLLEILPNCKILIHLVIAYPEGPLPLNSSTITLPYLQHLGLYVSERSSHILSNLVAPILDTFYIFIADDILHEQFIAFDDFLGRSGCKLQSLIITNNSDRQSQSLIPFLKSRNLIHLEELEISAVDDHVLEAMTITDDSDSSFSPIILPVLRRLNLDINCEMVREGLLGSMLLGWVRTGIGLNHVSFAVRKQYHGFIQDLEVIEKVRELGIHATIHIR